MAVLLGLDVGDVRIGIAVSDVLGKWRASIMYTDSNKSTT